MRSGQLRHLIWFKGPFRTADGQGGYTTEYKRILKAFAKVEPLSGNETLQWAQVAPTATHKITLIYQDGITTDMRIEFGTREFLVEDVRNRDEANRELTILAKEHKQLAITN